MDAMGTKLPRQRQGGVVALMNGTAEGCVWPACTQSCLCYCSSWIGQHSSTFWRPAVGIHSCPVGCSAQTASHLIKVACRRGRCQAVCCAAVAHHDLPSSQEMTLPLPNDPDCSVDPVPPACSAEFAPDLLKMAFDQLFEVIKPREQEMVQALLVALQKQEVLQKPDMLQQGLSEHTQQLEDLRWVVSVTHVPLPGAATTSSAAMWLLLSR